MRAVIGRCARTLRGWPPRRRNLRGFAVMRAGMGSSQRRVVNRLVPSPHPDRTSSHPAPRSPLTKHTILSSPANRLGTDLLALDEEIEAREVVQQRECLDDPAAGDDN
ncbi:MAG TPA: hypothetical protein VIX73_39240, partial [Kofleriaceae bacterium]